MARDAEKAQSTLNRLLQAKQGAPIPATLRLPHQRSEDCRQGSAASCASACAVPFIFLGIEESGWQSGWLL